MNTFQLEFLGALLHKLLFVYIMIVCFYALLFHFHSNLLALFLKQVQNTTSPGSSKTAIRILIFSVAMGAKPLF